MPDVWTHNPVKLRRMLESTQGEIVCRVEPRIIPDRDPEWTCHLAGVYPRDNPTVSWYGDIYIHDAGVPKIGDPWFEWVLVALVIGVAAGYVLGRRLR